MKNQLEIKVNIDTTEAHQKLNLLENQLDRITSKIKKINEFKAQEG
ncbi:hypothetical protein V1503_24960 [Bacillus sp. SCS-151]